jgi:hypothetical protein
MDVKHGIAGALLLLVLGIGTYFATPFLLTWLFGANTQTMALVLAFVVPGFTLGAGLLSLKGMKVMRGASDVTWFLGLLGVVLVVMAAAMLYMLSGPGVASFSKDKGVTQLPTGTVQTGAVCDTPLGATQTLTYTARDAKTNAELSGVAYTVYTDAAAGYSQSTNVTKPGGVYTIYATKSGYLAAVKTIQTSCVDTSPLVELAMEDYEASLGISVLNSDGLTANAVASRETLTANVPDSVTLRLKPAAVNQFIAGGKDNTYRVWVNASNSTSWDKSGFVLKGLDGADCQQVSDAPSAISTTTVVGFACGGDFNGDDVNYQLRSLTIKPSSSFTSGNQTIGICIAGSDYYQKVNTPNANSLQSGGIKDNSAAIQTLQCLNIHVA